jgi:hypothetical protein
VAVEKDWMWIVLTIAPSNREGFEKYTSLLHVMEQSRARRAVRSESTTTLLFVSEVETFSQHQSSNDLVRGAMSCLSTLKYWFRSERESKTYYYDCSTEVGRKLHGRYCCINENRVSSTAIVAKITCGEKDGLKLS